MSSERVDVTQGDGQPRKIYCQICLRMIQPGEGVVRMTDYSWQKPIRRRDARIVHEGASCDYPASRANVTRVAVRLDPYLLVNGDFDLVRELANTPGRCLGDESLITAAEWLRDGESDAWTEDYVHERPCPDLLNTDADE